jgi:hypothetical protein
VGRCEIDASDSGLGAVGSEHGDVPLGSIKVGEFLD